MKKKLIIIGGGYSGLMLINEVKNDFDITLVDKQRYHVEQTEIHRYLGEKINLDDLIFSYEEIAKKKNFSFKNTSIKSLDIENKTILLKDEEQLHYDYLVLATGSQTFFPKQIENLERYKLDIKNLEELKLFKARLEALSTTKEKNKHIVIAGGGLSGAEIAIELAQLIAQKAPEKNIQIHLVEQQATVLPGLDDFLINETTKILDKWGIKRIHNEHISKVEENTILLANGQKLPYDLSLFLLGVVCEQIENSQDIQYGPKNQFEVNEYFQLENHKEIFCIGDVAQTKDSQGNYNPPTAQLAIRQAEILAKNLKNMLKNKPLRQEKNEIKGVLVDLDHKNAVGIVFNIKIKGLIAYILKRVTTFLANRKRT